MQKQCWQMALKLKSGDSFPILRKKQYSNYSVCTVKLVHCKNTLVIFHYRPVMYSILIFSIQYISSSQAVHELPTSSSPQPPAYPHNIPYSPGPVVSHRNSSTCISPISSTPYETVSELICQVSLKFCTQSAFSLSSITIK